MKTTKTYEVEFTNDIFNRIVFEVQAEQEEEAKQKAYQEMEDEGYSLDATQSDGYYFSYIKEIN